MKAAMARAARAPRPHNRRQELLDAAARLFNARGFEASTVRDIAAAAGMLSGSVYYHVRSKEELFVAVHEEGIRRITGAVTAAVAGLAEPWARLEAAAAAHLESILNESDYAAVVIGVFPPLDGPLRQRLVVLRNRYEALFRALVDDLPLASDGERKYFRLALLGALNWAQTWYRADGHAPARIAAEFVGLLRAGHGQRAPLAPARRARRPRPRSRAAPELAS